MPSSIAKALEYPKAVLRVLYLLRLLCVPLSWLRPL